MIMLIIKIKEKKDKVMIEVRFNKNMTGICIQIVP